MEERKQRVVETFDAAAETYGRTGPDFFWPFGRRLVELAGVAVGERVLDVACGTGAVAVAARDAGSDVTAIDLAPGMVERCRAQGIDARVMDAERLELPDGSFDVALCGFGVFFWPDHDRAFAELHRVLRPGGRLAFTTFTDESDPRWAWHEQLRPGPPPDTPFLWRNEIERIVRKAGFAEVGFVEEDHEMVFADAGEWLTWKWSHGGRRELAAKSPAELEQYRAVAFGHLAQLDPIALTIHGRITTAKRP